MFRIVFHNVDKSDIAEEVTTERFYDVYHKFPDLKKSSVIVTLSMENSPTHSGLNMFTVKFLARGGRYNDVILEKSAPSMYAALAIVVDHLLERLNRHGDRNRVRRRNKTRQFHNSVA